MKFEIGNLKFGNADILHNCNTALFCANQFSNFQIFKLHRMRKPIFKFSNFQIFK